MNNYNYYFLNLSNLFTSASIFINCCIQDILNIDDFHLFTVLVTGFPVWASIVSIGVVCTFYTTIVSIT